jgi:hypothetical protein
MTTFVAADAGAAERRSNAAITPMRLTKTRQGIEP